MYVVDVYFYQVGFHFHSKMMLEKLFGRSNGKHNRLVLVIVVMVHFIGMQSWAAVAEMSQECLRDGEPASYSDTIELLEGLIVWTGDGVGFICINTNAPIFSNTIPLGSFDNCTTGGTNVVGNCGPYNASLGCNTENENRQTYVLLFVANYTLMNRGTILLQNYVTNELYRNINVRVGVEPDPPEHANLTFPLNTVCRYDWVPPNGNVIGNIGGYNLSYEGDCGICSPIGMVNSSTFTAECRGWIANGQTCYFEVTTFTEDCGFYSTTSTNVTSILDNTFPSDIEVVVDCSQDVDSPQIHVTWNYTPPEVENTTIIPGVLGFLVTICDDASNNYSQYLNNSGVRAYSFNSTSPEFRNASLEGSSRFITVTVETVVMNFSNVSDPFSVNRTMADISSTLTTEQCITVSINQRCNESANSFQALLQFADGTCENNGTVKTQATENSTLRNDYEACIPVGIDPICFSAVVSRNDVEVARIVRQELILLQCNTSTLSPNYNTGVQLINSSSMNISSGVNVPHNSMLYLQCSMCTLMETNTTRCVNGTFEPLVNQSTYCNCLVDPPLSTGEIIGVLVGGAAILVIIVIIVIIVVLYCNRNRSKQSYKPQDQACKPDDGAAGINTPSEKVVYSKSENKVEISK